MQVRVEGSGGGGDFVVVYTGSQSEIVLCCDRAALVGGRGTQGVIADGGAASGEKKIGNDVVLRVLPPERAAAHITLDGMHAPLPPGTVVLIR
jgi:hypothetical protein